MKCMINIIDLCCSYTLHIHYVHTPCTYTMYLHHVLTPCSYTTYIHYVHTPCSYTTYVHTGDTLGTMDTAEAGPFNQSQHPWYKPRTVALPLPMIAYRNGKLTIDASDMATSCCIGKNLIRNRYNSIIYPTLYYPSRQRVGSDIACVV
jgi:hypothetical protein